jgi:hypothetical protein
MFSANVKAQAAMDKASAKRLNFFIRRIRVNSFRVVFIETFISFSLTTLRIHACLATLLAVA